MFYWFKVFNLQDFEATGRSSKSYLMNLEFFGLREILVTKGVRTSVLFDGVFLSVELNATNPFTFEDRAVFLDPAGDVWIGVALEN